MDKKRSKVQHQEQQKGRSKEIQSTKWMLLKARAKSATKKEPGTEKSSGNPRKSHEPKMEADEGQESQ